MPRIDRVDQLPLPNLNLYAGLSCLALFYAVVYALTSAKENLVSMVWADVWCAAAVLNMGCCCFFLLVRFIYSLIFGKLQNMELQHMRDKFWNFVFYKFIFVFGVMNVQEIPEMLCWCVWFAVIGALLLTEQLCKDRFQFLSFSPNTPASSHAKIILLLSVILLSCAGLFMVCAVVGWQYGFNHFTFLYSEVFILFARTLHSVIKHIIHLWDMHHDGVWENRSTYTYYTELVLEVAVLCVDFMHHVHMLLWANMFLSVASLILLMKLRFLYQEIQRRLKRHHNFILVSETMENRFVRVSGHELVMSDETCAICWEKMNSACRLPCGHLFHTVCLRAWLEQDTVCPTCRTSLSEDLRHGRQAAAHRGEEEPQAEDRGQAPRAPRVHRNMRNARNWLLRFNGASIASWLPTFSLELHQDDDARWISDAAELHRVAQQIHSMFPHVPLQAITLDLADSHSVSLTVDRILSDSIYIPEGAATATPIEGGGTGGRGEQHRNSVEVTPPPLSSSTNTSITEDDDDESATSTAHSTPNRRLSSEPHPQQEIRTPSTHAHATTPTMHELRSHDLDRHETLLSHDPQNVDSQDHNQYASLDSGTGPSLAHKSTPTLSSATPTSSSHDNSTELRRRKFDAESIRAAKAIPGGDGGGGGEGEKNESGGKEFLSTGKSYSQLFTSLQERKAELLRKAKRNYAQRENTGED